MLTSANPPSPPSILLHVELRTTNSKNKWTRTDQQATNTQVTTIPDTMEKHQRWLEHTKNSFIYTQNIFIPHLAYTKYRNSVDNAPRKKGSRVQFKNWSMEEITLSVQPLLGWFLKERRLKSNVQYWGFIQSKSQMSNTMGGHKEVAGSAQSAVRFVPDDQVEIVYSQRIMSLKIELCHSWVYPEVFNWLGKSKGWGRVS